MRKDVNKLARLVVTGSPRASSNTCDNIAHLYFNAMERVHIRRMMYNMVAENPFAGDIALPESYEQAINGPYSKQWRKAIQSEIASLIDHKVFRLIDKKSLSKGANVISVKWVFKVKPNADGTIDRFKCRLCARGFLQKYGVDYSATFSPVASAGWQAEWLTDY